MISDRPKLLAFITTYFDLEELKTLCFQLDISFEDLAGTTRESKARELLGFVERHERAADLHRQLERDRPWAYAAQFGSLPAADVRLTVDHARRIQALAQEVGRELGRESGRFLYQTAYARLNAEFRVRSYRDIPAGRFSEAERFLADWMQQLVQADTLSQVRH